MTLQALPGGNLVQGMGGFVVAAAGPVDVSDWSAAANGSYSTNGRRLDVSRWMVQRIRRETEVTHSGCMGAITRRSVAFDYLFRCEIAYDVDNPPDVLLGNTSMVGLCFLLGDPSAYTDADSVKRYCSPAGMLLDAQTVTDSTGTDVVRQIVTGKGSSLMFLLPDEATAYATYLAALQQKGWMA